MQWERDTGLDGFRFLSDTVAVVANSRNTRLASLDLFSFLEHGNTGKIRMTKVAALRLPDTGFPLYHVRFGNIPSKNGVARSNRQLDNAVVYAKPFTNSSENIIYVIIEGSTDKFATSFVTHSSALLRHASSTPHASPPSVNDIPWPQWGPTTTRWSEDTTIGDTITFCGQRWLRTSSNEIWDFNQYRVQQLGEGFAAETETASISIVTKPSRIGKTDVTETNYLYSSLPYVRIVSKQWPRYAYACLDDDRIFASAKVSTYRFTYSIPLFDVITAGSQEVSTRR